LQSSHCFVFASYISETFSQSGLELFPIVSFTESFAFSLSKILFFPEFSISGFEKGEDVISFSGLCGIDVVLDRKAYFCFSEHGIEVFWFSSEWTLFCEFKVFAIFSWSSMCRGYVFSFVLSCSERFENSCIFLCNLSYEYSKVFSRHCDHVYGRSLKGWARCLGCSW